MAFGAGQSHGARAAGASIPYSLAYLSAYSSEASGTEYEFTGCALGTPHKTRRIYAFVGSETQIEAESIATVTIAGVAATSIVNSYWSHANGAAFYADVPAGETGTVTVDWSVSSSRCAVALVATYGPAAITDYQVSNFGDTYTDIVAGGTLFAWEVATSNYSVTWEGITAEFYVYDASTRSEFRLGYYFSETGETDHNVDPSSSGESTYLTVSIGPSET